MKITLAASLIAGVAAFAPASQNPTSTTSSSATALNLKGIFKGGASKPKTPSKFADELGAQAPLGYFDPLGVMETIDTQERFDYFRRVEITHGRTAMLAFLGQIVTRAGIHFPGEFEGVAYADIPPGVAAFDVVPQQLSFLIFGTIIQLECVMRDIPGTGNEFVGDLRNDWIDFGWDTFTEEQKLSKRRIELNNGRAAMMGILGLIVHEQLHTNMPIIGQL